MDVETFLKKFYQCEAENDFFSKKIMGRFGIWDYIRYPLFYELLSTVVRQDEVKYQNSKNSIHKAWAYLWEFVHLIKLLLQLLFAKKTDLLIYNYDRKNLVDNKKVNITFYPIIKTLSHKYTITLLDPSVLSEPVEGLYPCSTFLVRPFTSLSLFFQRFVQFSAQDKAAILAIGDTINAHFGTRLDFIKLTRRWFGKQYCDYLFYKPLFKKLKPKLILHSDTGTNKGWIQAAHEQKISVADYQHSLMSDSNILYQYPTLKKSIITFSDMILTFGTYWHDKYKIPIKMIPTGFPFLEMKTREIQTKKGAVSKETALIIINCMFSAKKLEQIAIDLSSKMPSLRVYFKLRLEEYEGWKMIYSKQLGNTPNITVIDTNDPHLYELFMRCKYQLGVNSTALVEGMAFDLQTFVFKDDWYHEMDSFLDSGHAKLVENADDIIALMTTDPDIAQREDLNEIFRKNPCQNLINTVNELIS